MLWRLTSSDPRFKTVCFHRGLNLLVAETTAESRSTDSRNGVGKSSLIELLHFLLGGRADRNSLAMRPELRGMTFSLSMDWRGVEPELVVSRRGSTAKRVRLDPDVSAAASAMFPSPRDVTLGEWQALLESQLFGLLGDHPGVSGRALLSFLIRKVGDHGFNEATRSFGRQPETQSMPNLAYLLGLDSDLVSRYQDLASRKNARDQLKKAVDDPVWGRVVGKTADLRGQIAVQKAVITRLKGQIAEFRVVPEYESMKARADEISRQIRALSAADLADRRNLDHLEAAVQDSVDPEVRYMDTVYKDLGIALGDQVQRRFDEVKAFHQAVVRNRRVYLEEEIKETNQRLETRAQERASLDVEQARLLRELSEGGALEALTMLQKALAREEASLGALQHRFEAAQAVEASSREIESDRIDLARAVDADLNERHIQVTKATQLFNELVQRLYGSGRRSYLSVEASKTGLKITPKIDSDVSQGINRMAVFCFDLTLAVLAHRERRAPDFLVHDSHLFDGVDGRQLSKALQLGVELAVEEGMQYIVTINEDELIKAESEGFRREGHVIEPTLTDAYADGTGGLFGFRFDRHLPA